jgi:PAS domain S-box-containing protein
MWVLHAAVSSYFQSTSFLDQALLAVPAEAVVFRVLALVLLVLLVLLLPRKPTGDSKTGPEPPAENGDIRFRGLAELLPEPVFEADLSFRLTYANRRAFEVFGYTREDLEKGLSCLDMLIPSEREAAKAAFQERVAGPDTGMVEYTAVRKDGTPFPILIHPSLMTKGGQPVGVRGVLVDISERKVAESTLKESERRFRNIVEASPMGVFLYCLEPDDRLVLEAANPAASRILGVDASAFVGRTLEELFPPLIETGIPDAFCTVARSGKEWHGGEIEYDHGGIRGCFEVSAFQTAPSEVAVMFLDVTERRAAENEVRMSEERLRLATRSGGVGVWEYEIGSDHLEWDEWSYELYGVDPSNAKGGIQRWRDCVHPDDLERAEGEFMASLPEDGPPFDSEFRVVHQKTGEIRHLRGHAGVFRDEDGTPVRALGTHWDITASKRQEEALRESENRFRKVIEQMNDAMYILYDGGFDLVNPSFCELTGVTPEEVSAPTFDFWDLVAPGSVQAIRERQELRKRGEEVPDIYEFEILHRAGHTVQVEASVREIEYLGGLAVLGVLRDVTEKRSLKEQLLMAQKMESVGRLSGGVAHDLNNLLTPILGYGDLVLGDLPPHDEKRESVEEILQAALRARDLVQQLLAFGRRQAMEFKTIDLNGMIEDFGGLLRRAIQEDIEIRFRPSPDDPHIQGDRGQLEQVVMNFAVNAQDAMPDGGTLSIETDVVELDEEYAHARSGVTPGSYAMLCFSDTGIGMDRPTKEKIFEPFFTTKERGKGTGLGLSTVYGIIKQHEGNIWAYSEPGRGTTFKCYIPLSGGSSTTPEPASVSPAVLDGDEAVMVVEDEDTVRALAVRVLQRHGYRVYDAPNGEACLDLLRDGGVIPDLLLTDVVMPGLNGRELFEEVRALHPDVRVLYMSGYTEDIVTHRGVLMDGIPFIQKPFAIEDLARRVRAVLEEGQTSE